jgi:hypothetical protein
MSAPDTNLKKQEKQHRPSLFGIGFSLLWGTVLLIGLTLWVVYNVNEPDDGVPVDGAGATGNVAVEEKPVIEAPVSPEAPAAAQ